MRGKVARRLRAEAWQVVDAAGVPGPDQQRQFRWIYRRMKRHHVRGRQS